MNLRGDNSIQKLVSDRVTEMSILRQKRRSELQMQKRRNVMNEENNQNQEINQQMEEENTKSIEEIINGIYQKEIISFHKLTTLLSSDDIIHYNFIHEKGIIKQIITYLQDQNESIVYLSLDIINSYISFDNSIQFTIDSVQNGLLPILLPLCLSQNIQIKLKALNILNNILIDTNYKDFKYYEIFTNIHLIEYLQLSIDQYLMSDFSYRSITISILHSILLNEYIYPTTLYSLSVQLLFEILQNESDRTLVFHTITALCAAFHRPESIQLVTTEESCKLILSRMNEGKEILIKCLLYFYHVSFADYQKILSRIGLFDTLETFLHPNEDVDIIRKVLSVISNICATDNEFVITTFMSHQFLQFTIDSIMKANYRECSVDFAYILFNVIYWISIGFESLVTNYIVSCPNFIFCINVVLRTVKDENKDCFAFGLKAMLILFQTYCQTSDIIDQCISFGLDAFLEDVDMNLNQILFMKEFKKYYMCIYILMIQMI